MSIWKKLPVVLLAVALLPGVLGAGGFGSDPFQDLALGGEDDGCVPSQIEPLGVGVGGGGATTLDVTVQNRPAFSVNAYLYGRVEAGGRSILFYSPISLEGEERRKHARVLAHLLASAKDSAAEIPTYGRITDISLGGVYMLTTSPHAPGEKLSLQFKIPGSGYSFAADAVVRRVRPGEGMGLEFGSLDAGQREALQEFISRENS